MKKITKVIVSQILMLPIILPLNTFAMNKTETIYSTLNYDGSISKTTISTRLSELKKGEVDDYTYLESIKNINGNEKFTRESSKVTWKSTGKDIYYQGKINNELPIKVKAIYYLNNEEVEPSKIQGKKGNIKVTFTLTNNDYNNEYGMYVPYVVDITTVLNSKTTSNYKVTNGKNVSVGNKTIITAIASPGLYENTSIEEFKEIDKVTISYDTDKYEKTDYYFVITPKVLSELDVSKLEKASAKLSDVNKLKTGGEELEKGTEELESGTGQLNTGLESLNKGLKEALDGSEELANGLDKITTGSKSLSSLPVLVQKLYDTYNSNMKMLEEITNGTTEKQLTEGIKNATEEKAKLESLLSQVNAGIAQLEPGESLNALTEEQIVQLSTLRAQKMEIETGIKKYEEGISEAYANLSMLPKAPYKISGANEVIAQVLCGILNTDSIENINDNLIKSFNENILSLINGIENIHQGSKQLNKGINELYEGSNKLVDGSEKIEVGTQALNDGVKKLKEEGISKIVTLSNKLISYSNKVENLTKMSKNYSGFSSNNSNETIFIYKLSTK